MSQFFMFLNDPNNRRLLLELLNRPLEGTGYTTAKPLTGKADCLYSAWPEARVPFFSVLTDDEKESPPLAGDYSSPPKWPGDDKGIRSHDLERLFDIGLAQHTKYPNLTRRSVGDVADQVFKLAMDWEKEVSAEPAPVVQQESKMMVVPVNSQVLYRTVPEQYHSQLADKWYHVTLDYEPTDLEIGLGSLVVTGYAEAEGGYAWLTVRFRRMIDKEYGPWEDKNPYGGNLHITLKAPWGKAGQIGKLSPTKTETFFTDDTSPFEVIWCPVVKKRMDKGMQEVHLQFFFDLDDTLVIVDRDTIDEKLIRAHAYLRSSEVMRKNTQPTPLLRALANSFPKIRVVTSRRLIEGQGASLDEMETAFVEMMVTHQLPAIPVSISFMDKKLVTYGAGDREVLKGAEKAKRVISLSLPGAVPVHFDDSLGTISGLVSVGGVIGCHYDRHNFTFRMDHPKPDNLPRHLVLGFQGMPGSGKSTVLAKVAERMTASGRPTEVCSTDQIQAEGFSGPDTYPELERRIKQALKNDKSVLVDTCFAGKGINSLKKRPPFLTHMVGWDTWGFDSLWFLNCLWGVISRRGHRLTIPGAAELFGLDAADNLDDEVPLGDGPVKMEDNGPGLIEMTSKLKTIRDLQDFIAWMNMRNHMVQVKCLDGRKIETCFPNDPIPNSTIITIEYAAEMKNLVDAYGREARGVSEVFWNGRFYRFKGTFPVGPETGINSTEKGRPRDSGYRDIAGRVAGGHEFKEEIHVSLKEDGECFGVSLNTGEVAKALTPWFNLPIKNETPAMERARAMLKEISGLIPGSILTISSRGTPGLGLTGTAISLRSHIDLFYRFLSGVSQEMGVDPASITVAHGFKLTIAHLLGQLIPMLQEMLVSGPWAGSGGITVVGEFRQAFRRCLFKDYSAQIQMGLAVSYPDAGYSITGFNGHSAPFRKSPPRLSEGDGGDEDQVVQSGLYAFAPASTQADLLDKYGLPYAAFTVTNRPDLLIEEFEQLMRADKEQFKDKLNLFKSKFRGRFGFHPEGFVMMLKLMPPTRLTRSGASGADGSDQPGVDEFPDRWVYLKLKTLFYYLAHAKTPNMFKLAQIPDHHQEWFPLVRFQRSIKETDFEQMHREIRGASRMMLLHIEQDRDHTHHRLVKQLLDQKGSRAAFLAMANQRDVKYTGGELHHVFATVLVWSPSLAQMVLNHPLADQGSLDPLWEVVHRLIRFFGSEPLPHELPSEEEMVPMTYDGLMTRAEQVKYRHLSSDLPMLFGR